MTRPAVHSVLMATLLLSGCVGRSATSSETALPDATAELRSLVSATVELESFRTISRTDPEPGFPSLGKTVTDYIAPDRLRERTEGVEMVAVGRSMYFELAHKPGFYVREGDPHRGIVGAHLELFESVLAATHVARKGEVFTFRLPADLRGNPEGIGEARGGGGRLAWLRIAYAHDYGTLEVSLSKFNAVPPFSAPPKSRVVSRESATPPCGPDGLPLDGASSELPGGVTVCGISTEPPP